MNSKNILKIVVESFYYNDISSKMKCSKTPNYCYKKFLPTYIPFYIFLFFLKMQKFKELTKVSTIVILLMIINKLLKKIIFYCNSHKSYKTGKCARIILRCARFLFISICVHVLQCEILRVRHTHFFLPFYSYDVLQLKFTYPLLVTESKIIILLLCTCI